LQDNCAGTDGCRHVGNLGGSRGGWLFSLAFGCEAHSIIPMYFVWRMSLFGPSRHFALRPMVVAFGLKRTFVSCPPGQIYEFTPC
jgi:hypothetical protein